MVAAVGQTSYPIFGPTLYNMTGGHEICAVLDSRTVIAAAVFRSATTTFLLTVFLFWIFFMLGLASERQPLGVIVAKGH